jgi:hypothetical protein
LIPELAATMRSALINFLQTQWDLTFDRGKLTQKKFWSIHVTTSHHQSFCLELNDVTGISQTGKYLAKTIKKVILYSLSCVIHIAYRFFK